MGLACGWPMPSVALLVVWGVGSALMLVPQRIQVESAGVGTPAPLTYEWLHPPVHLGLDFSRSWSSLSPASPVLEGTLILLMGGPFFRWLLPL